MNLTEKCKDLEQPLFIKTANTKIDVDEEILPVEYDKEIVKLIFPPNYK